MKSLIAAIALSLISVSAISADEDLEINRNCYVLRHTNGTTHIYQVGSFNFVRVEPYKNGLFEITFVHHSRNLDAVISPYRLKQILDRYYACSGMELDKKAFP